MFGEWERLELYIIAGLLIRLVVAVDGGWSPVTILVAIVFAHLMVGADRKGRQPANGWRF